MDTPKYQGIDFTGNLIFKDRTASFPVRIFWILSK